MSWTEIDWNEIPADNELIPEGEYVFELMKGTKYSRFDSGRIEFPAKIVEGEWKGRVTYASYPNPADPRFEWVKGVFVRMLNAAKAQGAREMEPGEDPVEYLNEVAGYKFKSQMKHRIKPSGGDDVPVSELKITNIKPIVKQ